MTGVLAILSRELRLSVQVDIAFVPEGSVGIEIKATDVATGQKASVQDHFVSENR